MWNQMGRSQRSCGKGNHNLDIMYGKKVFNQQQKKNRRKMSSKNLRLDHVIHILTKELFVVAVCCEREEHG